MALTGLLAPAAFGLSVRRRGQPSVSVTTCRVVVLGGFPTSWVLGGFPTSWVKARSQDSGMAGKQRKTQILVYVPVTYVSISSLFTACTSCVSRYFVASGRVFECSGKWPTSYVRWLHSTASSWKLAKKCVRFSKNPSVGNKKQWVMVHVICISVVLA